MITYFTKEDLVDFGKYLLSQKRTKLVTTIYKDDDSVPLTERLQEVYEADIENFLFDPEVKHGQR